MITKLNMLAICLVLLIAGCTAYTGSGGNSVTRSLTWFSFVAGDDIKAACVPGSRDHFRFVYNAVYKKQIRAYELVGVEDGAKFSARARNEGGQIARFSISNPLGPWELEKSNKQLTNGQAAEIVDAFGRDAAAAPDSAGQQLKSNEFYWIVAACNAGSFRVWAFDQDKVDLSGLGFASALRTHDQTDVNFRDVEPVEGFDDNAFYIKINAAADGTVRGL